MKNVGEKGKTKEKKKERKEKERKKERKKKERTERWSHFFSMFVRSIDHRIIIFNDQIKRESNHDISKNIIEKN